MRETEENIYLLEGNIKSLLSLKTNEAELRDYHSSLSSYYESETKKFYSSSETNLTNLSLKIMDMISKNGLAYTRFQKNETGDPHYIEFAITGSATGLVSLLSDINRQSKYINIMSMTVSSRQNMLSVIMRLNYVSI